MAQEKRDSEERIEAWLAGRLTPEESKAVEKELEAPDDDDVERDVPDAMLLNLDRHAHSGSRELEELIALVATEAPEHPAPPGTDSWRELLLPSEDPASLGRLDHYEVLELLATGGMGIVFRAK